jgi:glycosyltransferase involved in cell wall biosynthesis
MRILIVSHKPPYPIIDGGCLAMARLLQDTLALPELSAVDYFCLATHKHPFVAKQFPTHLKLNVFSKSIDTRVKPIAALLSLLKQESYNLSRFYTTEVADALKKRDQEQHYDFIIFESLFTAIYAKMLKKSTRAKLIYRSHNIEHQIWKDLAKSTKNLFKRWYLLQLAYSLKWAERSIWSEDQGGLNMIMSISNQDAEVMEAQTLTSIKYLPASIEQPKLRADTDRAALCFIGAFDWQPNIDAVDWIIKEVLPDLRKNIPDLQFHVAGKGSDLIARWQTNGVQCHGFVPDSKEFIATHGIFVSGLHAGSGVKMKVLEALSVCAPMVLTAKSAEGLSNFSYKTLHHDAATFAQECLSLLTDPEARKQDGAANFNYYQQHFYPQKVQADLLHLLKQL